MECMAISANTLLIWVVFGICMGFGWGLINWPFRRWAN